MFRFCYSRHVGESVSQREVSDFDWKGHRYLVTSRLFLIICTIPRSYPVAPIKFGLIGGKAEYGSYKSRV